jgi:hypothetical protein
MNTKLFSDNSYLFLLLLIVLLGIAYVYLNIGKNINGQSGGGAIPQEYIPLTYKFRYLAYIGMVFAIVFAISMYLSVSRINNMTFSNYIKKGLEEFNEITIKKRDTRPPIHPDDPSLTAYRDLIQSCSKSNQYATYAGAFCRLVAPCTCCNEQGYYNENCPKGTIGANLNNRKN